jgi:hypothetical protein
MRAIKFITLMRVAARRNPGYLSAALALATKTGNDRYEISTSDRKRLLKDFPPLSIHEPATSLTAIRTCSSCHDSGIFIPARPPGWGDRAYLILHPIALMIDRCFPTALASCPACNRRRAWLNTLGRWITALLSRLLASLRHLLHIPPA